jgi:hypothetical protein
MSGVRGMDESGQNALLLRDIKVLKTSGAQ